jgi:Uma2 family endonuclease
MTLSTVTPPTGTQPAVLHGIDWGTYSRLLRVLQSRRRFRLTYDRGTLEIMSPLWEHEGPAYLIGRMIDMITLRLRIPVRAGGSLTLRRRRLNRGVEPDKCYWVANASHFDGRTRLDLRVDPPPDLAVEIDLTSRSVPRMPIYAALGVPEVWRLDRHGLTFHSLVERRYQPRTHSLAFPTLSAADLASFLQQFGQVDDTTFIEQFESWVQQNLLPQPPTP